MVLGRGVRRRTVRQEHGIRRVQAQGLRVQLDGLAVVLLRHGGVALALEGLGLLLLLLRRGGSTGSAGTAGGRGLRRLELLVDGVDLEEVLGADGGGDGGRVGGVDLEGLGDAVDGHVDGVAVVGGQGAVGARRGQKVTDGEREALLGVLCRLEHINVRSPITNLERKTYSSKHSGEAPHIKALQGNLEDFETYHDGDF